MKRIIGKQKNFPAPLQLLDVYNTLENLVAIPENHPPLGKPELTEKYYDNRNVTLMTLPSATLAFDLDRNMPLWVLQTVTSSSNVSTFIQSKLLNS